MVRDREIDKQMWKEYSSWGWLETYLTQFDLNCLTYAHSRSNIGKGFLILSRMNPLHFKGIFNPI